MSTRAFTSALKLLSFTAPLTITACLLTGLSSNLLTASEDDTWLDKRSDSPLRRSQTDLPSQAKDQSQLPNKNTPFILSLRSGADKTKTSQFSQGNPFLEGWEIQGSKNKVYNLNSGALKSGDNSKSNVKAGERLQQLHESYSKTQTRAIDEEDANDSDNDLLLDSESESRDDDPSPRQDYIIHVDDEDIYSAPSNKRLIKTINEYFESSSIERLFDPMLDTGLSTKILSQFRSLYQEQRQRFKNEPTISKLNIQGVVLKERHFEEAFVLTLKDYITNQTGRLNFEEKDQIFDAASNIAIENFAIAEEVSDFKSETSKALKNLLIGRFGSLSPKQQEELYTIAFNASYERGNREKATALYRSAYASVLKEEIIRRYETGNPRDTKLTIGSNGVSADNYLSAINQLFHIVHNGFDFAKTVNGIPLEEKLSVDLIEYFDIQRENFICNESFAVLPYRNRNLEDMKKFVSGKYM